MRRVDLTAAVIIIVVAGLALGWLIPHHVPREHDAGDLPPSLMPTLSMATLALAALLLGWSAWRRQDTPDVDTQDNEAAEKLAFGIRETGHLLVWLAAAGITWLLLKYAGFEVAAGVVTVAGGIYGGIRNPLALIAIALAVSQVIDKAVWYGLHIKLP